MQPNKIEKDTQRSMKLINKLKLIRFFIEQQKEKKSKDNSPKDEVKLPIITQSSPVVNKEPHDMDFSNFDIPIFTEEFLDHNKTRESELRQLRKINTDYEQQNAILQKHIENMRGAITKLETEINQQTKNNSALQQHLEHLQNTLTNGFGGGEIARN
ncbi:unnamed protein product [Brassicogethes aeneus]|uniref:Uncharacterized protein n=1 Tax=Brassicogethes aeneus TaxID=1431903 RepID=A0A9P0AXJ3_BRAAE|nr:unnamed protein product [Brassicogethes aeneus]